MGHIIHFILGTILIFMTLASCANKKESDKIENTTPLHAEVITEKEVAPKPDTTRQAEVDHQNSANAQIDHVFRYDVTRPVKTSILSSELIEISALSFDHDANILYAVNDELGILFSLDPANGNILDKKHFGKRGDYEGVEVTDRGMVYVIKSNGDIVTIQKSGTETTQIKTELRSTNDVEGLGYDRNNKRLLIACKGSPHLSKNKGSSKKIKSVYGWSTETQTLIQEPILTISDEDLISYFEKGESEMSKSEQKKFKKRLKNFSPSGIAYQENEDLYYLISSVGKLLITINKSSQIQHIVFLDETYFAQPEGICFGEDNALYISNEGRGLVAKLMKFDYK